MNNPPPTPDACPHCGAELRSLSRAGKWLRYACVTCVEAGGRITRGIPCYEREITQLRTRLGKAAEGLKRISLTSDFLNPSGNLAYQTCKEIARQTLTQITK